MRLSIGAASRIKIDINLKWLSYLRVGWTKKKHHTKLRVEMS